MQEAWLRLAGLSDEQRARIRDLTAWLTTVVGRICLDQLRSATARRERYVGEWLPEPIVTPLAGASGEDPLEVAVRDEGIRMAAMVVLDKLPPQQRVAVVLHDGFAVPFGEIGEILGCSADTARQYGSRGRRALAGAEPPARSAMAEQHDLLERVMAAMVSGDVQAVAGALHPDVVLVGDSNGKARTARQIMVGPDKIARFLVGLSKQYPPGAFTAGHPVLVNGELGLHLPPQQGGDGCHTLDRHVQTMAVRDGKIAAIYDIVNPDKLTRLPAWCTSRE